MDSESLAEPQAWISGLPYPNKLTPTSLLPITQQASPIFESEQLRVITHTASFLLLQFPLNTLRYTQSSWTVDAESTDTICYLLRNANAQLQDIPCKHRMREGSDHTSCVSWSLTSNDTMRKSSAITVNFFFPTGATTHCGFVFCSPLAGYSLLAYEFSYHTRRRATVHRTALDEWSVRRRVLYLTTNNTHNTQTSLPPVRFGPTIAAGEHRRPTP